MYFNWNTNDNVEPIGEFKNIKYSCHKFPKCKENSYNHIVYLDIEPIGKFRFNDNYDYQIPKIGELALVVSESLNKSLENIARQFKLIHINNVWTDKNDNPRLNEYFDIRIENSAVLIFDHKLALDIFYEFLLIKKILFIGHNSFTFDFPILFSWLFKKPVDCFYNNYFCDSMQSLCGKRTNLYKFIEYGPNLPMSLFEKMAELEHNAIGDTDMLYVWFKNHTKNANTIHGTHLLSLYRNNILVEKQFYI